MKHKLLMIIIAQMFLLFSLYVDLQAEIIENNIQDKSFSKDHVNYILPIKSAINTKNLYISAHYKGISFIDKEVLTIRESKTCDRFTLVITPQVKCKKRGNLITNFKSLKEQKCAIFYITRTWNMMDNAQEAWCIEKEPHVETSSILPKNALIIFIHPDLVQDVLCEKMIEKLEQDTICLPSIRLRSNVTEKELSGVCLNAMLLLPDVMAISSQIEQVVKCQGTTISSLKIPRKVN